MKYCDGLTIVLLLCGRAGVAWAYPAFWHEPSYANQVPGVPQAANCFQHPDELADTQVDAIENQNGAVHTDLKADGYVNYGKGCCHGTASLMPLFVSCQLAGKHSKLGGYFSNAVSCRTITFSLYGQDGSLASAVCPGATYNLTVWPTLSYRMPSSLALCHGEHAC